MSIRNLVLSVATVALFAGCSPESVDIEVSSSDIAAARAGSVGYAQVKAVYSCSGDDAKSKFPSIKKTTLPYLGDGSKMVLKDDNIIATFKVPVVSSANFNSIANKAVAALVLDGEKLTFKSTSYLKSLNRELNSIDSSMEADFKAKHMTFSVSSDSDGFEVGAIAAFVDSKAYLNYTAKLANGESTDIDFRCSSEESVYHTLDPFIIVK